MLCDIFHIAFIGFIVRFYLSYCVVRDSGQVCSTFCLGVRFHIAFVGVGNCIEVTIASRFGKFGANVDDIVF